MDANWFQQALERAGASQADLARHLRLAPSAISRMLKGERQMKILEAVQTAQFLNATQEEVLRHAGAETPPMAPRTEPPRRGRPPKAGLPPGAPPRAEPIPIRAAARRANDHELILEEGPIGYTARPNNLVGVRGAYAIYMCDETMEPRYQQGWLLHVNPFKPPIRGRDVVVQKTDKTVLIKQFLRWDNDALVLRQLNPEKELRIPRAEIGECHLVVGVDQEG